jgi:hypothetical protein
LSCDIDAVGDVFVHEMDCNDRIQSKSNRRRCTRRKTERRIQAWEAIWTSKQSDFREYETGRCTRSKGTGVIYTEHKLSFKSTELRFVGYTLAIARQSKSMGFGLKTLKDIPPFTPITQYEGVILSKDEADRIRKGENGKDIGTHFASCYSRLWVINGFSVISSQKRKPRNESVSERVSGGVPIHIDDRRWKGMGGGSLCNHSDEPNAKLVRSKTGEGKEVFVVCKEKTIMAGEFINVSYGKQFVRSTRSNM